MKSSHHQINPLFPFELQCLGIKEIHHSGILLTNISRIIPSSIAKNSIEQPWTWQGTAIRQPHYLQIAFPLDNYPYRLISALYSAALIPCVLRKRLFRYADVRNIHWLCLRIRKTVRRHLQLKRDMYRLRKFKPNIRSVNSYHSNTTSLTSLFNLSLLHGKSLT